MPPREPTVFFVDDDPALRESVSWLLESRALRVRTFESAEEFLDAFDRDAPGCLLLDVRMRGMGGLDLQSRMLEVGAALPIILITGHGDVPMAVRAMRAGAMDVLEKPVNDQVLLERIRAAIARDALSRSARESVNAVRASWGRLTPRERDVVACMLRGMRNKEIAAELTIAEKTVEVHRKRVLQKMSARNAVELVRIVADNGLLEPGPAVQ